MPRDVITFHSTKDIEPLLEEIREILFERLKSNPNITTMLLLLCGLLNKTHELTETAIWAIRHNRPQSAVFMLRGLFETLAFIYFIKNKLLNTDIKDRNEIISAFLFGSKSKSARYKSVNILTCIDKATKTFPKLRKNYDELSELVHPNAASHFYIASTIQGKKREINMQIPFYKFKNTDKKATINQVGECCFHILNISKELLIIS